MTDSERHGQRAKLLDLLLRTSRALGSERDRARLVEQILLEAQALVGADGGTLYLVEDHKRLRFAIMRNDSLGIHEGGTAPEPCKLPPVPLVAADGQPNLHHLAARCYWRREAIAIDDVAEAGPEIDTSKIRDFDAAHGYETRSFWSIPLLDSEGAVLGVIQLVNARDQQTGTTVAFDEALRAMIEALACLAAVALENRALLDAQRSLLESFIQVIANAIDAKSPYTGAHCARVPMLAQLLTRAACDAKEGPFAGFFLSEQEWHEVRIAAWMHDCGKVTTPPHVMDKATKLQTIFDRIELLATRFELAIQQRRVRAYERAAAGELPLEHALDEAATVETELRDAVQFLRKVNRGAEFLAAEDQRRLEDLARRTMEAPDGTLRPLLDPEELENLSVQRGTLTEHERLVINSHMVHTIDMLEALPFPPDLAKVPEYAGGHHERMDGRGYPLGIHAGTMSIPARILAIADVFEALTAADRPYKPAKPLSTTMAIMGAMKRDNHIDPDLFDLFVRSGVYREFAREHLAPELNDEVDEQALLALRPAPMDTATPRRREDADFLPAYRPFSMRHRP